MSRIIDLRYNEYKQPFIIEHGKLKGKLLVINEYELRRLGIMRNYKAEDRSRRIIELHPSMLSCGSHTMKNIKCYNVDNFTLEVLTSLLISNKLNMSINNSLKIHAAFTCDKGYILKSACDIGTLSNFTNTFEIDKDICYSMLAQLYVMLHGLSKNYFIHGNPTYSSIVFSTNPANYTYNSIIIRSPFSLIIQNYTASSFTLNNVRYMPNECRYNYFENRVYKPNIKTIKYINPNNNTTTEVNLYKINSHDLNIFIYQRNYGLPIFSGSFDYYCFITLLMCSKVFYDTVMKSVSLSKIWRSLWYLNEYNIINERLTKFHNVSLYTLPDKKYKTNVNYEFMNSIVDCAVQNNTDNMDNINEIMGVTQTIDEIINTPPRISNDVDESIAEDPYINDNNYDVTSNDVYELLSGLWLRCDVLDYIHSLL